MTITQLTTEVDHSWRGDLHKQVSSDACSREPCIHGKCSLEGDDGYRCNCEPGYEGFRCERNIDDCIGLTCHNRGVCIDQLQSYRCRCYPGYTGDRCELFDGGCTTSECINGYCYEVSRTHGHRCVCRRGYTGMHCEMLIDYCASSPCFHGDCVNEEGGFTCIRCPGYTGILCESQINYCESSPCSELGTCRPVVDGFFCDCLDDVYGDKCELDKRPTVVRPRRIFKKKGFRYRNETSKQLIKAKEDIRKWLFFQDDRTKLMPFI
ncbi:hypothetical protein LSH36_436g04004 [Paralvinella palmiformis]|uniref:EGF-like domain-containing protein n=1 Tax=Paralvinella palmiformis TaxID=53620 RepID=A0AAD9MZE6_9ANNE|nr:hypothetical protein LSH36_436g04004 [Paralvinella palmiformis]